jgi:hypothetical protein
MRRQFLSEPISIMERNTVAAPAKRVMASHQPLIALVAT